MNSGGQDTVPIGHSESQSERCPAVEATAYIRCKTPPYYRENAQDNMPPRTKFQAHFLDNGESANVERCVLPKYLKGITPKPPFWLRVDPPCFQLLVWEKRALPQSHHFGCVWTPPCFQLLVWEKICLEIPAGVVVIFRAIYTRWFPGTAQQSKYFTRADSDSPEKQRFSSTHVS